MFQHKWIFYHQLRNRPTHSDSLWARIRLSKSCESVSVCSKIMLWRKSIWRLEFYSVALLRSGAGGTSLRSLLTFCRIRNGWLLENLVLIDNNFNLVLFLYYDHTVGTGDTMWGKDLLGRALPLLLGCFWYSIKVLKCNGDALFSLLFWFLTWYLLCNLEVLRLIPIDRWAVY